MNSKTRLKNTELSTYFIFNNKEKIEHDVIMMVQL